jgi:hypothetical protein
MFGSVLVRHALRRGTFLVVTTRSERRKLAIGRTDVAAARRALLEEAPEFGYSIVDE